MVQTQRLTDEAHRQHIHRSHGGRKLHGTTAEHDLDARQKNRSREVLKNKSER